jgi:hypothetical protein
MNRPKRSTTARVSYKDGSNEDEVDGRPSREGDEVKKAIELEKPIGSSCNSRVSNRASAS